MNVFYLASREVSSDLSCVEQGHFLQTSSACGIRAEGQPGLHGETLSQNKKRRCRGWEVAVCRQSAKGPRGQRLGSAPGGAARAQRSSGAGGRLRAVRRGDRKREPRVGGPRGPPPSRHHPRAPPPRPVLAAASRPRSPPLAAPRPLPPARAAEVARSTELIDRLALRPPARLPGPSCAPGSIRQAAAAAAEAAALWRRLRRQGKAVAAAARPGVPLPRHLGPGASAARA